LLFLFDRLALPRPKSYDELWRLMAGLRRTPLRRPMSSKPRRTLHRRPIPKRQ
jgi:hypothetical protein